MKKIDLVVAALLSPVSVCSGQVSVYGLLDAGIVTTTGLRGGSSVVLASGVMEGSRFGLRAREDLGGGYKISVTSESRIEVDTGDSASRPLSALQVPDRGIDAGLLGLPSSLQPYVSAIAAGFANDTFGTNLQRRLFDRSSNLGVLTPFGTIVVGNLYTPVAEVSGTFDTMQTESALSLGQAVSLPSGFETRRENAVSYSLNADKFRGAVFYGARESRSGTTGGRAWGTMASYSGDKWRLGFGYQTRNNERGKKSLTNFVVGGRVQVGANNFTAFYGDVKDSNPGGLSGIASGLPAAVGGLVENAFTNLLRQDGTLYHLGYRRDVGAISIAVAGTRFNDKRHHADVDIYGTAFTYRLSKRTDLNMVLAWYQNKGLAQTAPGHGGFLGGFTSSAGGDARTYAIGVRHRF